MKKITKDYFGHTKTNEEVFIYTLENENLKIEVLNYGCIIKKIMMPDKKGCFENIVLSFDTLKEYEENIGAHLGAIVGRNAGRIKNGELLVNSKKYFLEKNNGNNNLHGYPDFFASKIWKVEEVNKPDELSLILKRSSPHMEGGFPGKVDFTMKYTLKENQLTLEYEGCPYDETYINLTNHTYFNLSGNIKEDIGNQNIKLWSDNFIEVNEETLPIKTSSVEDRVFDLRKGRYFSEIFNSNDNQVKIVNNGLDHPFIFSRQNNVVAKIFHEKSGRSLEVITDQEIGVIYTGNYLNNIKNFQNNILGQAHLGFCIETQDYPDRNNSLLKNSIFYNKNKLYKQKTTFILQNV